MTLHRLQTKLRVACTGQRGEFLAFGATTESQLAQFGINQAILDSGVLLLLL